MSGVWPLLRHSLRRWRGLFVATATVLVAFQVVIILTARDLELSGRFRLIAATMPAFMSQFANMGAASFPGFVLFGFSHPLPELFLIAMAIGIGSEPAAEIDTKFVDLVMARPLARRVAILRTIAMLLLVTAGAVTCIIAATALGLRLFAPPSARLPQVAVVRSLGVNLAVLVLAWGGIAVAMASVARRRATVAAACGLLAFAAFVLDYAGRFWTALGPVARLSPFHYYDPFALIGGRVLAAADIMTLATIFAAGSVFAALAYARRDL